MLTNQELRISNKKLYKFKYDNKKNKKRIDKKMIFT